MLTWHYISQSAYKNMSSAEKTSDKLFSIRYGDIIYNGATEFTDPVVLYDYYISTPVTEKIYINKRSLEGRIWDGSNWTDLITPVRKLGEAYIKSTDIQAVNYNSTYNNLTLTMIDGSEDTLEIEDMLVDIVSNNGTSFTIVHDACYLESGYKVHFNDIVSSMVYTSASKILGISFINGNKMNISFDQTTYDGINDIAGFTITGNAFAAEAVQYYNQKNILRMSSNNVYTVYRCGVTDEIPSVDDGISHNTSEEILDFTIANTIAILYDKNGNVMFTIGMGHEDEILVADKTGNAKSSGVKVSKKIFDVHTDESVPTEKAIFEQLGADIIEAKDISEYHEFANLTPETAVDTRVPSEKALVMQLSWEVI